MKRKYIIVEQVGKVNTKFKVTNPDKIEFWKMIAQKASGSVGLVITKIIEEGEEEVKMIKEKEVYKK